MNHRGGFGFETVPELAESHLQTAPFCGKIII